jgi:DNA helicase-2/ATP-dependent DNA helicase PcrA
LKLRTEAILADLTEAQKEAVTHLDGPMLVVAGPGSGKTRVITRRVAWLASQGVSPFNILGLTFTNKAAEEMRTRLLEMGVASGSTLSTFHSLCARLLREFAVPAGLKASFTIYDETDRKAALREACRESGLDFQLFPPARILRRISRFKNQLLTPDNTSDLGYDPLSKVIKDYYEAYQLQLDRNAALDFDDLLMRLALLLENDPDLVEKLSRRYRYILVDEYQDTNACQYRIAHKLAESHGNFFVTGDPDQSIYGWRGADISNILAFEEDWPQAKVIRLEFNFRSTPEVLDLADGLIRANTMRKDKRLIARKERGERPKLFEYWSETKEAGGMVAWIQELQADHELEFHDIAVFYRTNAMSRVFEEALHAARIPYQIVRGVEFYRRREIKDMLAYLRLLVNPSDHVALLRVINRPARGIGASTIQAVGRCAESNGMDMWTVLADPKLITCVGTAAQIKVQAFVKLMEDLRVLLNRPIAAVLRSIFEITGLKEKLEAEKNDDALENVLELISSAARFDEEESSGPEEYLRQLALLSDPDTFDSEAGSVSLMTLHAAKGLEFPAVRIVGVEDGIIPHERSRNSAAGLEEERRLLFVGITRAERFLALSLSRSRTVNGASRENSPSPFLANLEGLEEVRPLAWSVPSRQSIGSLDYPSVKTPTITAPISVDTRNSTQSNVHKEDKNPFGAGKRVHHPTLGTGRVEKYFTQEGKERVMVQFESGPRLNMDIELSNLRPL